MLCVVSIVRGSYLLSCSALSSRYHDDGMISLDISQDSFLCSLRSSLDFNKMNRVSYLVPIAEGLGPPGFVKPCVSIRLAE